MPFNASEEKSYSSYTGYKGHHALLPSTQCFRIRNPSIRDDSVISLFWRTQKENLRKSTNSVIYHVKLCETVLIKLSGVVPEKWLQDSSLNAGRYFLWQRGFTNSNEDTMITEQCARVKKLTYLTNTTTYKQYIWNTLTKPSLLAQ